jgi:D-alanine-D-alanine ligase
MSTLQRRAGRAAARRPSGARPLAAILHGAVPPDAPPDEQDVLVEVATVAEGLRALGFETVAVPLTLDLAAARRRLKALKPAVTFNLVESIEGQGRFVHLATALLDSLGTPYTGAGTTATFLAAGKPLAKRTMRAAGIPTAPWVEAVAGSLPKPDFDGPYIVKSVWEHASIGLDSSSIVSAPCEVPAVAAAKAAAYGGEWFAEQFIAGREFNLGLVGGADGPQVLPVAEMTFVDYPEGAPRIVDYAAKWDASSFAFHHTVRDFDLPETDAPLLARLGWIAKACWSAFGLTGYARVDFRVDAAGRPWVLEVNTNPCISPDGGFFAAAARAGLALPGLLQRILDDIKRPAPALSTHEPAAERKEPPASVWAEVEAGGHSEAAAPPGRAAR